MDTKKNYQLDIWSDSIFFNDCCNQELDIGSKEGDYIFRNNKDNTY